MSEANIWKPGSQTIVDPDETIEVQRFVATAAQSIFNLTAFNYSVSSNALLVFKNGEVLVRGIDYEETSTTSITLTLPASSGDIIYVVGFTAVSSTGDTFGKLYLGEKAAAPTLDNEGDALLDGALYYNSVTKLLYVYDLATTTWLQATTVVPATLIAATVTFTTQLVAKVSVANAQAITTSKIVANMQSKVGDTVGDELEMDAFVISGRCLVNGTIIFTARCVSGFASGTYNFNYTLQN